MDNFEFQVTLVVENILDFILIKEAKIKKEHHEKRKFS
jgi:hypothetical protein